MQTLSASAPFTLSTRRGKPWGAVLVLLLHVGVLGLLMSTKLQSKMPVPVQGLIQLRLIPWLADSASPKDRRPKDKPVLQSSLPLARPLPLHSPANATDVAADSPSDRVTANAQGISAPAPPASAPESKSIAPLKLSLPPTGTDRAPAIAALRDPRSNTQRPDFGERMATALGSDPSLREEIIAPGHRRIRKGSTCVDMNDSRDSQINPFDENARQMPRLMSPCKK
ncbi:hypothetical protein WG899_08165 [Paucibacter sp. AS339]|uniref:hypothetical protein n=1 Tax=Paucibacter hankyongi TaxID=3133434 RepID=UPI0030A6A8E2